MGSDESDGRQWDLHERPFEAVSRNGQRASRQSDLPAERDQLGGGEPNPGAAGQLHKIGRDFAPQTPQRRHQTGVTTCHIICLKDDPSILQQLRPECPGTHVAENSLARGEH